MGVATKTTPEATEGPQSPVANLGWLLSQASYVLTTQLTAALEELGISPRSFCLLNSAMDGEYTQIELAHAVGLDKTTMVVTLDELEEEGLAKRVPSSEDRRARVVKVTKTGERKVAQGEEIVERIQEELLSELPAGDRKAFLGSLTRLVEEATPAACSKPVRRRAPR
jgi:MarR family transcriptional regulator for hemolysin